MRQTSAWPRMKPAIARSISRASRAHGVAVAHRHPAIDGGDHAVPVDEQVEGDDRRHDEEGEDADERLAAGPQARAGSRRSRLRPASGRRRRSSACRRASSGPPKRSISGPPRSMASACSRATYWGSRSMKASSWCEQERHDQHQRQDEDEDEEDEDQERRPEPPEAEPLEAVGERVEEIGEREPGHEGQEDVAKDVERERRRRRARRARTRPASGSPSPTVRRASGRHVAQPSGEIGSRRGDGQGGDHPHGCEIEPPELEAECHLEQDRAPRTRSAPRC